MSDYPELRKQILIKGDSVPAADPRFVNTNHARACWVNYSVSYLLISSCVFFHRFEKSIDYFSSCDSQIRGTIWSSKFKLYTYRL